MEGKFRARRSRGRSRLWVGLLIVVSFGAGAGVGYAVHRPPVDRTWTYGKDLKCSAGTHRVHDVSDQIQQGLWLLNEQYSMIGYRPQAKDSELFGRPVSVDELLRLEAQAEDKLVALNPGLDPRNPPSGGIAPNRCWIG